jgi:hypothetical protein
MKGETELPERSAMASTKADLRELRMNSTATVQELKEFLGQLRGKSPQEMLGLVASSQLVKATFISTFLVAAFIFIFTAIPYYREKNASASTEQENPKPTAPADKVPEIAAPPEVISTNTDKNKNVNLAPLDVNETIPTSPNTNPLDSSSSDFLKDLE